MQEQMTMFKLITDIHVSWNRFKLLYHIDSIAIYQQVLSIKLCADILQFGAWRTELQLNDIQICMHAAHIISAPLPNSLKSLLLIVDSLYIDII